MRALPAFLLVLVLSGCSGGGGGTPEWSAVFTDLDRVILSVWGSGTDDVWTVGGGLGNGLPAIALHYDGDRWQEIDTGSMDSFWWVWGAPDGTVFMVGEGGTIVRYRDGMAERMDSGVTETLFGVWGTSSSDVWSVGGNAFGTGEQDIVLHYDGSAWTRQTLPSPMGVALFKVWGSSSSDVWVVGQMGAILHWDGATWTSHDSGASGTLFTVWGTGPSDVWATGGPPRALLHWDGSTWTSMDPFGYGSQLNGVCANGSGDVMVVGVQGLRWRLNDGTWYDDSDSEPLEHFHGAWMAPDGSVYAAGGNFLAPAMPGDPRIGVLGFYGKHPPPGTL